MTLISYPDIPRSIAGAKRFEVPGIWWNAVERLSWTMLGKPHFAYSMREVQMANPG